MGAQQWADLDSGVVERLDLQAVPHGDQLVHQAYEDLGSGLMGFRGLLGHAVVVNFDCV